MSETQPRDDIGDLVTIGKSGETYHRPDDKFLSNYEKEMIEAHADQIRDGLAERGNRAAYAKGKDIDDWAFLTERLDEENKELRSRLAEQAGETEGLKLKIDELSGKIDTLLLVGNAVGATDGSTVEGGSTAGDDTESDTGSESADENSEANEESPHEQLEFSQKIARIREEMDGDEELNREYNSLLKEWSTLQAEHERKGLFDRNKSSREAKINDLQEKIKAQIWKLAKEFCERRNEVEPYSADQAEMDKEINDDIFDELRRRDPELRASVDEVLLQRIEDRNKVQKAAAAIGRWFNRGGKLWRVTKAAATGGAAGVVAGSLTSLGFSIAGVGIPITAVLSPAASLAARYASKTASLDESLRDRVEGRSQGEASNSLSDLDADKSPLESSAKDGKISQEDSNKLIDKMFARSRQIGQQDREKANKTSRLTSISMGLGFAAGSLLGYSLQNNIAHAASGHDGGSTVRGLHEGVAPHDTSGVSVGDGSVSPSGGESLTYSPEAYNVASGEGWYQTFKDMGIPNNEWSSLLDRVGPQLHDMGVAYQMPDGSWGISNPGQLSQDVLNLIQNSR